MRLTYKAKDQHGKETGTVWYTSTVVGESIFPKSNREEQALKKLAAYEDTGLEPEAIDGLKKENKNWEEALKIALDFIPCWVSVTETEKLPSPEVEVLVYTKDHRIGIDKFFGMILDRPAFAKKGINRVTHWMPTPKPPQEEELDVQSEI